MLSASIDTTAVQLLEQNHLMDMLFRLPILVVLLSGVILLSGCGGRDQAMLDAVRTEIGRELQVGDSAEKIESYFKTKELKYSFDSYHTPARYQSIIRNVGRGALGSKAIQIYVYVDTDKRFTHSEVVGIHEGSP